MAIRLDYLARETGQNLIRNWLLSIATMLIVTVSLAMLGVVLLMGFFGLDNAFLRWNNDVSFIVYMNPDASAEQIAAISKDLHNSPQVDAVEYYDEKKSFALYQRIFRQENPEMLGALQAGDLPTSFRVKPSNPDAAVVKEMANAYRPKTGVYQVDFPDAQVRQVQNAGLKIRLWLLVGAVVLLGASVVLIFIAIQTAVFSRRREIEVMRLVGATNWFIRIPFIIEGLIQGLIGGVLAVLSTWVIGLAWKSAGSSMKQSLLSKFVWTDSQQTGTFLFLLGVGAVVGALGAFVSTLWYLRD
ncbi:MAG: permease-like cell division protein FtsX [Acidimicrobiales bacterium]